LALQIGVTEKQAQDILDAHRNTYSIFRRWSDGAIDHALLSGSLYTVFGWRVRCGTKVNSRSLRNFPLQANCAEMLRLACCLATERGVRVAAPIHDALLVEAPIEDLDDFDNAALHSIEIIR